MGPMDGLVAAAAPTRAPAHKTGMVYFSDQQLPRGGLLLEVAFEAEGLVARDQHDGVDRSMRVVAGGAALAQGPVLEHKRPPLGGMALEAGFVFR